MGRVGQLQPEHLLRIDILKLHAASRTQAVPRLFDSLQEARIILQTILEPVILRFESNQHTGWLAVARDVVAVDFEKSIVWIKWIGTHRDYDKINVREVRHDGN